MTACLQRTKPLWHVTLKTHYLDGREPTEGVYTGQGWDENEAGWDAAVDVWEHDDENKIAAVGIVRAVLKRESETRGARA